MKSGRPEERKCSAWETGIITPDESGSHRLDSDKFRTGYNDSRFQRGFFEGKHTI